MAYVSAILARPGICLLIPCTDQLENQGAGEQALLSFTEQVLPKIEAVLEQPP